MIFVVLTVRNQSESLPALLRRLEALDLPVYGIVVDDDSQDGTPEVVERYPGLRGRLRLVQHVRRHGAGRAMVAGLRQALALRTGPGDLVVTLPSGTSADLDPLVQIHRRLEEGMDLVVASRFAAGGGEPGLRPWPSFLSRALAGVLRVLFPVAGVRDYTSGYWGLRLAQVQRAFEVHGRNLVTSSGDPGLAEFLIRLGRMGVRAAEVPLRLDPEARKSRDGRFGIPACLGYLRMILGLLRHPGRRTHKPR